jgi:hypothetical protein
MAATACEAGASKILSNNVRYYGNDTMRRDSKCVLQLAFRCYSVSGTLFSLRLRALHTKKIGHLTGAFVGLIPVAP